MAWTYIISDKMASADRYSVQVRYTRPDGMTLSETYYSQTVDPKGWPISVINDRLVTLNAFDETALDDVEIGAPLDPAAIKSP